MKPGALVKSRSKAHPCMCNVLSGDHDRWPWQPAPRVEFKSDEIALVVEKHPSSIGATSPVWVLFLRGEFVAMDELSLEMARGEE
jgi:hypothetical protein